MFFKRKKIDSANSEQQLVESIVAARINSLNTLSSNEPKNEKAKTIAKRKYKRSAKRLTASEREVLKRLDNVEKILFCLAMSHSTHQRLVFSYLLNNDEKRENWMRSIIEYHEKNCH